MIQSYFSLMEICGALCEGNLSHVIIWLHVNGLRIALPMFHNSEKNYEFLVGKITVTACSMARERNTIIHWLMINFFCKHIVMYGAIDIKYQCWLVIRLRMCCEHDITAAKLLIQGIKVLLKSILFIKLNKNVINTIQIVVKQILWVSRSLTTVFRNISLFLSSMKWLRKPTWNQTLFHKSYTQNVIPWGESQGSRCSSNAGWIFFNNIYLLFI